MKLAMVTVLAFFVSARAFADREEKDIVPYTDYKSIGRLLAEGKAEADVEGKPSPEVFFPDPAAPPLEEAFEMPLDQSLPSCVYVKGYNFPARCVENGSVIFDSERDTQAVLENLKERHGKVSLKYNQIPRDWHENAAQRRKELGLPPPGNTKHVPVEYELIPEQTDYRSQEDKERQAKLANASPARTRRGISQEVD